LELKLFEVSLNELVGNSMKSDNFTMENKIPPRRVCAVGRNEHFVVIALRNHKRIFLITKLECLSASSQLVPGNCRSYMTCWWWFYASLEWICEIAITHKDCYFYLMCRNWSDGEGSYCRLLLDIINESLHNNFTMKKVLSMTSSQSTWKFILPHWPTACLFYATNENPCVSHRKFP
jgi:hypothetical protein